MSASRSAASPSHGPGVGDNPISQTSEVIAGSHSQRLPDCGLSLPFSTTFELPRYRPPGWVQTCPRSERRCGYPMSARPYNCLLAVVSGVPGDRDVVPPHRRFSKPTSYRQEMAGENCRSFSKLTTAKVAHNRRTRARLQSCRKKPASRSGFTGCGKKGSGGFTPPFARCND